MTAFASSRPAETLADVDAVGASPRPSVHEQIGFELGFDYARHAAVPPAPYGHEPSPLHDGLVAGRAAFGTRTLACTPAVGRWLQLRLRAWLRGRSVEPVQVTPHYLQQLETSHCPITRVALQADGAPTGEASIDRVRDDAGYAAGNLAMMSRRANHAKATLGFREAQAVAAKLEAGPLEQLGGLGPDAWARVAVLCSLVTPLPHAEAARLPLRVLPPNRLRLFNPVQALQALVSRQLLQPGWSRRMSRFTELLPGKALQRDFRQFFMALLPRVLEAGKPADTPATRWAIEDAWSQPLVLQRWVDFASQLDAPRCQSLVEAAAAHGLATAVVEPMSEARAIDGWNVESRGYVAHGAAERAPARPRQAQLAF